MSLARDIGGDLHAVGEPDAGDFTNSGVRLARSLGGHLGADPALEGRGVEGRTILKRVETARQGRHARLRRFVLASSLGELIDGGHLYKFPPQRDSVTVHGGV